MPPLSKLSYVRKPELLPSVFCLEGPDGISKFRISFDPFDSLLWPQHVLCCMLYILCSAPWLPAEQHSSSTTASSFSAHYFLFPLSSFSCMCIQTPLKLLSWPVSYLPGLPIIAFQIASLCICPPSGLLLSAAFPSSCFFWGLFPSSSVTSRCSLLYPPLLPIRLFLSSPQQFLSHTTAFIPDLPSSF